MGSSTKRRRSDIANPGLIIQSGSLNGNNEDEEVLNETCPVSKRIKLINTKFENGQVLYLKCKENLVSIYAGSMKVQDIIGKSGELLKYCMQNGFNYIGKVKNGYGEFQRTA